MPCRGHELTKGPGCPFWHQDHASHKVLPLQTEYSRTIKTRLLQGDVKLVLRWLTLTQGLLTDLADPSLDCTTNLFSRHHSMSDLHCSLRTLPAFSCSFFISLPQASPQRKSCTFNLILGLLLRRQTSIRIEFRRKC